MSLGCVRYDDVFAIWDDHDYGINNGDSSYQYKLDSKQIFTQFWDQQKQSEKISRGGGGGDDSDEENGIWFSHTMEFTDGNGDIRFVKVVMVDMRFEKDDYKSENGSFLNQNQWDWLEDEFIHNIDDKVIL